MVKAVNVNESPNTLGNSPKAQSSADSLTIENPEAEVEFVAVSYTHLTLPTNREV